MKLGLATIYVPNALATKRVLPALAESIRIVDNARYVYDQKSGRISDGADIERRADGVFFSGSQRIARHTIFSLSDSLDYNLFNSNWTGGGVGNVEKYGQRRSFDVFADEFRSPIFDINPLSVQNFLQFRTFFGGVRRTASLQRLPPNDRACDDSDDYKHPLGGYIPPWRFYCGCLCWFATLGVFYRARNKDRFFWYVVCNLLLMSIGTLIWVTGKVPGNGGHYCGEQQQKGHSSAYIITSTYGSSAFSSFSVVCTSKLYPQPARKSLDIA
jgi:hypothetical protein